MWRVRSGDRLFLFNQKVHKWLGRPKKIYIESLERKMWAPTLVSSGEDAVALRISLSPDSEPPTNVEDLFRFEFTIDDPDQPNESLYMFVPPLQASSYANTPAQTVIFSERLDRNDNWQFELPGQSGPKESLQAPIVYGAEFVIWHPTSNNYLKDSGFDEFLVVDDISQQPAERWIMVPATPIYTCESRDDQTCKVHQGTKVTEIGFRCDQNGRHCTATHPFIRPLYHTLEECRKACYVPHWECDQSRYQCHLVDRPLRSDEKAITFDECSLSCQDPSLKVKRRIQQKAEKGKPKFVGGVYLVIIFLSAVAVTLGLSWIRK